MTLHVVGASHGGELRIRDARPGDRDRIREVTLSAYQEYAAQMPDLWEGYRQNIVATLARVEPAEQIVAERDDTIVGTVLLYPPRRVRPPGGESMEMPWPEVRLLAVAPAARGQGIGADLMQTAMRMYDRMGFARAPELDFHPAPGVTVKGFRLDLGAV